MYLRYMSPFFTLSLDTFAATNPFFKTGLVTLSINPSRTPGLKAGESNGFILHAIPGRIRWERQGADSEKRPAEVRRSDSEPHFW